MKTFRRCGAPVLVAVCMMAGAAHAQEAPPTIGMRASIRSLDTVGKLAADLALPVGNLKQKVEGSWAFLGEGGVAGDRPMGVVFLANDALASIENAVVFSIPVVDGKATKESLTAFGAQAVEGQPELVSLNGTVFLRRTVGHLLVQTAKPLGILGLGDNLFAQDYAQEGNLAVAVLNLAGYRQAAPEAYKKVFVQAQPGLEALTPAQEAGQKAGRELVVNWLNKVDRLTLAVAEDANALHVRTWVAPFAGKAPANPLPRPVFPKGTIVQMHLVYPDAQWAGWAESFMDVIPATAFENTPPEQANTLKTQMKRLAKVFVGGDGVSIGVAFKENQPVVYLVSQMNQEVDYSNELKSVIDAIKQAGTPANDQVSQYDADGKTVTRWQSQDMYIDAIQDGKRLSIAIGQTDGKFVGELAAGGTRGESALFCAGAIDLGAAVPAAGAMGLPLTPTSPIAQALNGKGITWTAQATEQFLYVDVQVPKQVVKDLAAIFIETDTPADAPGATGAGPGGQ